MRTPNPTQIKVLMLKKAITNDDLMSHFGVKLSAIHMAIRGERLDLHFRILDYLRSNSESKPSITNSNASKMGVDFSQPQRGCQ
jgi:hypothetical protein